MTQPTREFRAFRATELRAVTKDDGTPVLRGKGVSFDTYSQDFGGWREVVRPTALSKTLGDMRSNPTGSRIYSAFNHDDNQILGRVSAGTLEVTTEDDGVYYEVRMSRTSPVALHVYDAVNRGDVNGSSFAFSLAPDSTEWTEDPDTGTLIREIVQNVRLFELGPVTSPAYLDTTSEVRALRSLADVKGLDFEEVKRCAAEGHLKDIVRAANKDSEERGTVTAEADEAPGNHDSDLLVARRKLQLLGLALPKQ